MTVANIANANMHDHQASASGASLELKDTSPAASMLTEDYRRTNGVGGGDELDAELAVPSPFDDDVADDDTTATAASPSFFSKKRNIVGMIAALAFAISLGIALGLPLGVSISTKPYRQQQQKMGTIYADEPALNDVEKVDGYKFEGIGFCVDGSAEGGKLYDYIVFYPITSLQACGERCLACPGKGQAGVALRGFAYSSRFGDCWCFVDDGAADLDVLNGACTGYFGADADLLGKGEIQGTDGNEPYDHYQCWKIKGRGKSKSSKRGKANNEAGGM